MQKQKILHLKPGQSQTIFDWGNKIITPGLFPDSANKQNIKQLSNQQNTQETEIHLPENSTLTYYFNWQNINVNRNITINLNGKGASAKLIGLFYLGNKKAQKPPRRWHTFKNINKNDSLEVNGVKRIILNSTIIHRAPNTYGSTFIKGALQNSSKVKLRGLIKINKGAHGSDDLLTEKILLLSPHARAEAVPMLEINANQVKATHAATISKLNPNHLYYLQTRGLNQNQTKYLIATGFLQEILDQFPSSMINNKTYTTLLI